MRVSNDFRWTKIDTLHMPKSSLTSFYITCVLPVKHELEHVSRISLMLYDGRPYVVSMFESANIKINRKMQMHKIDAALP